MLFTSQTNQYTKANLNIMKSAEKELTDGMMVNSIQASGWQTKCTAMVFLSGTMENKYEGSFADDKRHGHGVFRWRDGKVYDGNWEKGKQHGIGTFIGNDGSQRQGEWIYGKRVRWIDD